jgi:hypothetical protein
MSKSHITPQQLHLLDQIATELSPVQRAMCKASGVSEAQFRAQLAVERAEQAAGATHLLAMAAHALK